MLPRKLHIRMHNPHMPSQRIIPAKSLLLTTIRTPHLRPLSMNRILMSRQVVRPAKHRATRLPRTRVDPVAAMRAVACCCGHGDAVVPERGGQSGGGGV